MDETTGSYAENASNLGHGTQLWSICAQKSSEACDSALVAFTRHREANQILQ